MDKRHFASAIAFIALCALAYAAGNRDVGQSAAFQARYASYVELRDSHAQKDEPVSEQIADIDAAIAALDSVKDEPSYFYLVDLYNYEKFELLNRSDQKAAYHLLKETYNSLRDKAETFPYYDMYRLFGDICSRLITFENSAIKLSSEMKQYYEKGLKLKADSPLLLIGIGNYYLFAPAIGGGSDAKAFRYYNDAEKTADSYGKYMAFIWKALAYAKVENLPAAERELGNALTVYPTGQYALLLLDQAKKGDDIFRPYR